MTSATKDDNLQITNTIEDYLEAILIISKEKGFAQVTELANFLEVSKASITEMVSKLRDFNLVNYKKYGTISLTSKGKNIAIKVKDRHDTLESFLLLIGVSEEAAGSDCCVMEHDLSKETILKLKNFIEFLQDNQQKDILERFNRYLKAK